MAIRQEWMTLQQDWEQSSLRTYLRYDLWTPEDGLCILAGFDFGAHHSRTASDIDWTSTLSPVTFQGYASSEDEMEATILLDRMNDDLEHLWMIWENCRRDGEPESYSPEFFIEWALSKGFTPDWMEWLIGTGQWSPKPVSDKTTPSNIDITSLTDPSDVTINTARSSVPTTSKAGFELRDISGLIASELELAFVGDKSESGLGANNMLEVTERGQSRVVITALIGCHGILKIVAQNFHLNSPYKLKEKFVSVRAN